MKRLIALTISVFLLGLLLWHVDRQALWQNLTHTRWDIFALALALFIPQVLTIAWRWKRLVAPFTPLPMADSTRMVLAASTMNLVLPGKLGDLTKGWFLARNASVSTALGLGVVVFEKMLDVAALALFMLLGVGSLLLHSNGFQSGPTGLAAGASSLTPLPGQLPVPVTSLLLAGGLGLAAVGGVVVLYFVPLGRLPGMAWLNGKSGQDKRAGKLRQMLERSHATMDTLRQRGARRGEIIALSLLIWVLHLVQIYLFFLCLGTPPPAGQFLSMVPLAIFIGLIPISIAGFGTRDAALVALLPGLPPSAIIAAALYINLRYIIPALAGIPFITRYSTRSKDETDSPTE